MKIKILELYECVFEGPNTTRVIYVVAPSYAKAVSIADSTHLGWEDHHVCKLILVRFKDNVYSKL